MGWSEEENAVTRTICMCTFMAKMPAQQLARIESAVPLGFNVGDAARARTTIQGAPS